MSKNVKWVPNLGMSLIASATWTFSAPEDDCYLSVTHKPCRICKKKMVQTRFEEYGQITMNSSDICCDCNIDLKQSNNSE